jgi:hypothetical protein
LQNHKNNDKLLTLDDLKCDVELDKKKELFNQETENNDIVK